MFVKRKGKNIYIELKIPSECKKKKLATIPRENKISKNKKKNLDPVTDTGHINSPIFEKNLSLV